MTEQARFLTTAEAAAHLAKWSPATLRGWRLRGKGPPFIKPSGPRGKALYSLDALNAWLRGSAPTEGTNS